jgi:peptidoglycan/LPS O-acetylase OafA/YrhL
VGRGDDQRGAPAGEAGPRDALNVPILDSFRALAALGILGYHCWLESGQPLLRGGAVRDLLSSGFLAVSLFFVLSGFVLYLPVARRGGAFGPVATYARRRVARVLPAYYAVLAICLLAYPLMITAPLGEQVTAGSLLAHVALVQQEARLIPGYAGALGFGADPVVWTLSLEAAFYLLLPLVAAAFWRRPWRAIALAVAIGIAGRLVLDARASGDESVLLSSFPLHLGDFAAGMGAAMLYVRWTRATGAPEPTIAAALLPRRLAAAAAWRPSPRLAAAVGGAGAAAAVAALVVAGGPDATDVRDAIRANAAFMALLPFAFAAAITGLALAPARVRRPLELKALRWIGTVSYGVFLVHYPLLLFARKTLDLRHDGTTAAFLELTAFALPASLLLGWLSWVAIERPARRFAHAGGHRQQRV